MNPQIRFKKTDGSEFPTWEQITFNELYEPLNNNTYSRDCLNYEDGEAKNIHYGDILVKFGDICDVRKEKLPFVNDGNPVDKYAELKDGDIILADTAEDETVGKAIEITNVGDDKVISGLHTMVCRPQVEFASKYLGYYMNSPAYHNQLRPFMQGIKVTSIGRKNIAETTISYPAEEREQQKIADFLSSLDDVISASEEEVANLEKQKKAVMQKIFSQEVRFKKEDGSNFPDWENKRVSELGEIVGGGTPSTKVDKYWQGNIPWISSADLDENDVHTIRISRFITDEAISESATKLIPTGSILIITRVGVGKVAKTSCELCTSQDYISIINPIGNAECLTYLLSKMMMSKVGNVQGTSIKGIPSDEIKSFELQVPSHPDEQQFIADFLSSYDQAITSAKQELEKWKELKKGLLQQMFV